MNFSKYILVAILLLPFQFAFAGYNQQGSDPYTQSVENMMAQALNTNKLEYDQRVNGTKDVPGFCQLIDTFTDVVTEVATRMNSVFSNATADQQNRFEALVRSDFAYMILSAFDGIDKPSSLIVTLNKMVGDKAYVHIKSQHGSVDLDVVMRDVINKGPALIDVDLGSVSVVQVKVDDYTSTAAGDLNKLNDALEKHLVSNFGELCH